jgi:hypothetical protein
MRTNEELGINRGSEIVGQQCDTTLLRHAAYRIGDHSEHLIRAVTAYS